MLHKLYKSHNAHKKSKRLKFQSLEPRMVFDGALDSVIEVGLDLGNASGVNLPDSSEAEESLDIKEPTVTWKENSDRSVRGKNDFVALAPFIILRKDSGSIKEVQFILMKEDQLKAVYNEAYKEVAGYSDLFKNIKWNKKIVGDGEGCVFTLSAPSNASPEAWQAVLRSIMFTYEGDNPESSREITTEITYQDGTYEDHVVPITMQTTDDALAWKAETNRLNVTREGIAESKIFSSVSIKDADTWNLKSMVVRLRNPRSGDALFLPKGLKDYALTISQDSHTITLTGFANLAAYEDVLQQLRFTSTSQDSTTRYIEIKTVQENDSVDRNSVALSLHKEPVVGGAKITGLEPIIWQSGSKNVSILPQVTLESDKLIHSVTIKILGPLAMDHLSIKGAFRVKGIEMTINNAKNEIRLTGPKTAKEYEALLRKVQYKTTKPFMSIYQFKDVYTGDQPLSATRVIEVTIKDEKGVKIVEKVFARVVPKVQTIETEDFRIAHDGNQSFNKQRSMLPLSLRKDSPNIQEVVIHGLLNTTNLNSHIFPKERAEYAKVEGFDDLYDLKFQLIPGGGILSAANGKSASPEAWETRFRSLRFGSEVAKSLTPFSDSDDIFVELKDSGGNIIDTHRVLLQLQPFDAPLEWEAETNRVNVTSKGVAESKIFNALSIEDADGWNLKSMVVRLRNARPGDALFLPKGLKDYALVISQDSHTITLTGLASLAAYEDVLQQLRFTSTSQDPTPREIEINIVQENDSAVAKNVSLSLELLIAGIKPLVYEIASDVSVFPNVVLAFKDKISSVMIEILNPFVGDILSIEDGLSLGSINQEIHHTQIILRGIDTATHYQEVLRKIHYKSTQPGASKRLIRLTIQDEHGLQDVETVSLYLESQVEQRKADSLGSNDDILLFPSMKFTEESVSLIEIEGVLDKDSLSVRSTDGYRLLEFYSKDGFSVTRSSSGTYTIIGSNGLPQKWANLLRSLVFNHEGDDPTASRNISVTAYDVKGHLIGTAYGGSVELTVDDDGIILQPKINILKITSSGVPESSIFTSIFSSVLVENPDAGNLRSVFVRLSNPRSGDKLIAPKSRNGLIFTQDSKGQSLTLQGIGTFAAYEDALQQVRFTSTEENGRARGIDIEVQEENGHVIKKSGGIFFEHLIVGIKPVVYKAALGSIAILADVELPFKDKINSVMIEIIDPLPWDSLSIKDGLSVESINQTIRRTQIILNGLDTAAHYEEILRKVHYKSAWPVASNRLIRLTIEDAHGVQDVKTVSLAVKPQITWVESPNFKQKDSHSNYLFHDIKFTQEPVSFIKVSGFFKRDFLRVETNDTDGFKIVREAGSEGFFVDTYTISANNASPERWKNFLKSLTFYYDMTTSWPVMPDSRNISFMAYDAEGHLVATYGVSVAVETTIVRPKSNQLKQTSRGIAEAPLFRSFFVDPDTRNAGNITYVFIQFSDAFEGCDLIVPEHYDGLTFSKDLKGKSLTLKGIGTLATYEYALQQVRLQSKNSHSEINTTIEVHQDNGAIIIRDLDIDMKSLEEIYDVVYYKAGSHDSISIMPNITLYLGDKIDSAMIEILNPLAGDALSIKDGLNIDGIKQEIHGTQIILTGRDIAAHYQEVLRKVHYKSTQPGASKRLIRLTIQDEYGGQNVKTVLLDVEPQVEWVEKVDSIGNNHGVFLFSDMKFTEESFSLIEIGGVLAEDHLSVRSAGGDVSLDGYSQGGFTVKRYSKGLIIQGNDSSPKKWENFLHSLVFNHEGDDPTASRNISVTAYDVKGIPIGMYNVSVALTPDDDPLEWEAQTNTLRVTSNGVVESNIFDSLTLKDPDAALDNLVVRLKNPQSGDILFVPDHVDQKNLTITSTESRQTITFSGLKTLFAYQDVLRGLQFKSASKNLMAREIEIKVHQKNDRVDTKSVFVALKGEGFFGGVEPIVYKAGLEESVSILPKAKLKPGNLRSVAIRILDPLSGDSLLIGDKSESEADAIIVVKKTNNTIIRLKGLAAAQDYEKILQKIEYKTTQRNASVRTIRVIIEDQNGVKEEETFSLRVEPHVEWTEKPDSRRGNDGVLLFPGLIFSEKSIASLEIDGLLGEDRLRVRSSRGDVLLDNYKKLGFEAHMDQSKGLYMITSSNASRKSWERLLRSLVFNHEGDNPKGSRKISVVARDAEAEPVGRTYGVSVALKPVDDGIQWKAQTNRLTVTSDGVSASIFESLLLEDPDTENVTLSSMVIRLKDGQSEDSLVLVDQKGLRVTPGRNNQELKLEGLNNLSVYRDVLRGLQFKSGSQDLTPRKIEFELLQEDGSILLKKEVSISGAENIEWNAGWDGVCVLPNVTLVSDDQISFMKITLVDALPGDTLFMENEWERGSDQIIFGEKKGPQQIRLRGLGAVQDYERLLKKIYYKNAFLPVSFFQGTKLPRTINVSIKDEYGETKTLTSLVYAWKPKSLN